MGFDEKNVYSTRLFCKPLPDLTKENKENTIKVGLRLKISVPGECAYGSNEITYLKLDEAISLRNEITKQLKELRRKLK